MLIPERIPKATGSSTKVHPPFSPALFPGDGWGQNLNCFHPPCAGPSESSPTAVRRHLGFHRVAGGFLPPGKLWGKWSAMKIALLGLELFDWTGEDSLPIMKIASENNIYNNQLLAYPTSWYCFFFSLPFQALIAIRKPLAASNLWPFSHNGLKQ